MLKPLRDRIVVEPQGRTASTIIECVLNEKPNLGVARAVGPGLVDKKGRLHPLDVQVGDVVRFGEFAFPEFFEAGVKYLVMQEADVAGVVEEETA